MLYSGGTSNARGWATASNPLGPWTKYTNNPVIGEGALTKGIALRNSVLYQNNILYVYYAGEDGNLYCASGADPVHLSLASKPIFTIQGNISSLENTSVVKGPTGLYYLFFEGAFNSGTWQLGVATATSPCGNFKLLEFPLTTLQVAPGAATDGPWVEWTGSKFRMVYHATPIANAQVPSNIYTAESKDGINWNWPSVKTDGIPAPIRSPYQELNHNQAADPFVLRYNGLAYLYHTEQFSANFNSGGIVVNVPSNLFTAIQY